MHFNIYIDDDTGQRLNQMAEQAGESRNALIRKALRDWLERQGRPQWPGSVLDFGGVADMPAFEAGRDELPPPLSDPLA